MRFKKRLALSLCISGLLAALSAAAAFGFAASFDYLGHAKGSPNSLIGFSVKHPARGGKRVTEFTISQVPYQCSDAPSGATAGWKFQPRMRVKSRRFEGKGDWTGLPFDPVGKVGGKFRHGGVAVGDFKLKGELAGPGTHCHTGLLGWRATKPSF